MWRKCIWEAPRGSVINAAERSPGTTHCYAISASTVRVEILVGSPVTLAFSCNSWSRSLWYLSDSVLLRILYLAFLPCLLCAYLLWAPGRTLSLMIILWVILYFQARGFATNHSVCIVGTPILQTSFAVDRIGPTTGTSTLTGGPDKASEIHTTCDLPRIGAAMYMLPRIHEVSTNTPMADRDRVFEPLGADWRTRPTMSVNDGVLLNNDI